MLIVNVLHSSLYPYGLALARENGAETIFLEAQLENIHPDILGVRRGVKVDEVSPGRLSISQTNGGTEKPLVIVQIEVSTGGKLGGRRGRATLTKHAVSSEYADFFYILDYVADTPSVRNDIAEIIPGVVVYSAEEVRRRFGELRLEAARA